MLSFVCALRLMNGVYLGVTIFALFYHPHYPVFDCGMLDDGWMRPSDRRHCDSAHMCYAYWQSPTALVFDLSMAFVNAAALTCNLAAVEALWPRPPEAMAGRVTSHQSPNAPLWQCPFVCMQAVLLVFYFPLGCAFKAVASLFFSVLLFGCCCHFAASVQRRQVLV